MGPRKTSIMSQRVALQSMLGKWLGLYLLALFAWSLCWADELSMKGVLSASGENANQQSGFKQAIAPYDFRFPQDHLPHPDFKTEWWYLTGNLTDLEGRRFGYQFTLFRFALEKVTPVPKPSDWRAKNIYMAHLALTDVSGQQVFHRQLMNRDGLGLAGVMLREQQFQLWLEHWKLYSATPKHWSPLVLAMEEKEFALHLQLSPSKPIILQGEEGLSQKSERPGNASYYYSLTRIATQGAIRIGEKQFKVVGNSWFDREWSTSSLGANQAGWDWFAIQLQDGRDLMLYQLRLNNGHKDPHSYAVIVDKQGKQTQFRADQFKLVAKKFWNSPKSRISYPTEWELTIPSQYLTLQVKPVLQQQEWLGDFKYWEGAVDIEGIESNKTVKGVGYLEMTGYKPNQ